MPRERAMGTAFRLLDLGFFRIGGEAYAEENHSYGLATIRREHVSFEGEQVVFDYIAKSGKERYIALVDKPVAEAVRTLVDRDDDNPELLAYEVGRRLARRHLHRDQRLRQGHRRRRGLGQGLPHLARHGHRRGRARGALRARLSRLQEASARSAPR